MNQNFATLGLLCALRNIYCEIKSFQKKDTQKNTTLLTWKFLSLVISFVLVGFAKEDKNIRKATYTLLLVSNVIGLLGSIYYNFTFMTGSNTKQSSTTTENTNKIDKEKESPYLMILYALACVLSICCMAKDKDITDMLEDFCKSLKKEPQKINLPPDAQSNLNFQTQKPYEGNLAEYIRYSDSLQNSDDSIAR